MTPRRNQWLAAAGAAVLSLGIAAGALGAGDGPATVKTRGGQELAAGR